MEASTHKPCRLIFSDNRADKAITLEQYETINVFLASREQFIKISFDNGETEDVIKRIDIKGTKKLGNYHMKSLHNQPSFLCGYGKKHVIGTKCSCYTTLGCTESKMWEYIREKYPHFDGTGITKTMVAHVLERVREEKQKQVDTETPRSLESSRRLEEIFRKSLAGSFTVRGFNPRILETEPNTKIFVDRTPEQTYSCTSCDAESTPVTGNNWDWLIGPGNHTVLFVPQQCNACRRKESVTRP